MSSDLYRWAIQRGMPEGLDCDQQMLWLYQRELKREAQIERLRAALITCGDLACGDHHIASADRCAAIVIHVDNTLHGAVAEAEKGGAE